MKNKRGILRLILLLILLVILAWLAYTIYQIILIEYPEIPGELEQGIQKVIPGQEPESTAIEQPTQIILPSDALPDRYQYNLEKETFDIMNQERTKRNLQALVWQEAIANTAFKHAKDMYENDYINHTNLQGLGPDVRIAQDKIFNLCSSENIFYIESKNPDKDLAEKAVQGWLDSPGHRKNLLDGNITRAGVGIYCKEKECYVNANHICSKQIITEQLQKDYIYFFQLYPTNYSFNLPIQINFQATATKEIDLYIIPDQEQYENYVRRKSFLFTKQYASTQEIQDTAVIQQSYGFMIRARNNAELQIDIEFL